MSRKEIRERRARKREREMGELTQVHIVEDQQNLRRFARENQEGMYKGHEDVFKGWVQEAINRIILFEKQRSRISLATVVEICDRALVMTNNPDQAPQIVQEMTPATQYA